MRVTLYGIPNCNTVKKAMDWLKAHGVEIDFHDFKKKGISASKLEAWFGRFGWEKVVNKNGLTFKKLDKERREAISSAVAAKNYLMENTSAIKRPVIEWENNMVTLGFIETELEQAFAENGG